MVKIPDAANKVPMMFRAQTAGRCQLQRIIDTKKNKNKDKQDVELWTSEWIEKAYDRPPKFGTDVQTQICQINWRFVTNGGQDDGIIRPVLGAYGWPYYPGSSMKGIFRSACTPEQSKRYCGRDIGNGDWAPGILRFHGGYPTNEEWQKNLVDIVHPQQSWQVGMEKNKSGGAFALISLYQPELMFGISADRSEDVDWKEVWQIWDKALSKGIGCRVSTGYGQPSDTQEKAIYSKLIQQKVIYSTALKGRGMAPKLLNGKAEFRPNIFRAAIRGHALRIFGGLTNGQQAIELVETLFGGVQGDGKAGLLGMNFEEKSPSKPETKPENFGQVDYRLCTYKIEGKLSWLLAKKITDSEKEALTKLIGILTQFAMIFGGFGKSWRRADHRLFFSEYYEEDGKPLIGCHWEWSGQKALKYDVRVRQLNHLARFIDEVRRVAMDWIKTQKNITPTPDRYASNWREAWHPKKVEVWGRRANDAEDSQAIRWFHEPYRRGDRRLRIQEQSIYRSHLAGEVSQVGRIWHRMYPLIPRNLILNENHAYLELLIFFPDDSLESKDFLDFLNSPYQSQYYQFQKLWPTLQGE